MLYTLSMSEETFQIGDEIKHKQHGWSGVVYYVSNEFIAVDVGSDRIRPAELPEDWTKI